MEAYRLAEEVRKELYQNKTSASSLLRKCRSIAKLLKNERQFEWIDLELNGYSDKFPTYKELKGNLPSYRWAVRQFFDQWGKPILVTGKIADLIQDYPLVQSMAELEGFATTGIYVQGDEAIAMLRDKFGVPALQSHVPSHRVVRVIDAVKSRIQEFVDEIISDSSQTRVDGLISRAAKEGVKQSIGKRDAYALYRALDLHPRIRKASEALFRDGHYSSAILEAFKEVNSTVKERSGRTDLDGKPLMDQVFKFELKDGNVMKKPSIQLNDLQSQSDRDEQQGFQFLFMGASLGIRNPKAHDRVAQTDPFRTLEYIAFASLLCKRMDEARKNPPLKSR
jgi:uncharacterized protein (TIGR02391 family)